MRRESAHDIDQHEADGGEPGDGWQLPRLHPRLLLAAMLVALVMVPVGVFLAALGVFVLEVSGGAARDTSLVVAVAGFVVTDFWGGGVVAALTRARAREVAIAWTIARAVVLLVAALVATRLAQVLPVQLLLAAPAAWAGARAARKQSAMRRAITRERSGDAGERTHRRAAAAAIDDTDIEVDARGRDEMLSSRG